MEWNIPGVRPLGPDIAVFRNVKRSRRLGNLQRQGPKGAIPALVVEVISRSTRKNDLGIKVDYGTIKKRCRCT